MKLAFPRIGLPLLAKELAEQAARPRTYIVRVVYAILLFLAGFVLYYQVVGRYNSSPFAVLGKGRELFQSLVMIQFVGIYIFMPAMTCGVITIEKERSSLGLLLLTKLGPWTILLEKYLGRILPMFSFLILSLPLLVIAYSLGGISQQNLWNGVWFLSLTTFQVGALAILCSAFFRTTVGAFIGSYLFGIVMLFWLPVANEVFKLDLVSQFAFVFPNSGVWNGGTRGDWIPFCFVGPAVFDITARRAAPIAEVAIASCPTLLLTLCMLMLARVFLVRRAFLSPTNWVLNSFKKLDRFFVKINDNRLTKGRVLISDNTQLNTILEPVAWRETTKSSLGSVRYLVRLFILLETPVVTIGLLLLAGGSSYQPFSYMLMLLWVVAVLIVAVKATSLVAGERSHETLDVLLTTPMRSSEIVKQKFRGVKRLILAVSIPLVTCILLKTTMLQAGGLYNYRHNQPGWVLYAVCALSTVAIYLPMVAWLSLLIGVRIRSQTKAIFVSLATIVAWCVLPVVLLSIYFQAMEVRQTAMSYLLLLSPATVVPVNEFFELNGMFTSSWFAMMLNCGIYSAILFIMRWASLRNLDHHLGRSQGTVGAYA